MSPLSPMPGVMKHLRMWRSGNASPCHGEAPGPIPGIRSQAPVAESGRRASLRNWCPRGREGPNPSWGTSCGAGPRKWACPAAGRRLGSEGTKSMGREARVRTAGLARWPGVAARDSSAKRATH
jgi:hypothetical protein